MLKHGGWLCLPYKHDKSLVLGNLKVCHSRKLLFLLCDYCPCFFNTDGSLQKHEMVSQCLVIMPVLQPLIRRRSNIGLRRWCNNKTTSLEHLCLLILSCWSALHEMCYLRKNDTLRSVRKRCADAGLILGQCTDGGRHWIPHGLFFSTGTDFRRLNVTSIAPDYDV